jgi:hypothetical protein
LRFYSVVSETSGLLGYDAVFMGECFLTFRRNVVLSSSGAESSRKGLLGLLTTEDKGTMLL